MKLIVINSSNYVPKSGNKYVYSLPSSVKLTTKSKIGVSAISVYNSTFNITAARANNSFKQKKCEFALFGTKTFQMKVWLLVKS